MSSKVRKVFVDDKHVGYSMYCPGCRNHHAIYIDKFRKQGNPIWKFTGTEESPTIRASILVTWDYGEERQKRRCHSFITDGHWKFLADCLHPLAGQTIPMLDIEDD